MNVDHKRSRMVHLILDKADRKSAPVVIISRRGFLSPFTSI